MSANSSQQRSNQLKDWYKWFNNKYDRHAKIQQRKHGNKNQPNGSAAKF